MADGFQITPELIETIQQSTSVKEFSLPDGGKALAFPNGRIQEFRPKTALELRREELALAMPETVHLSTLAGLAEYVKNFSDGDVVFVVKVGGPCEVSLWDYADYTARLLFVTCQPQGLPAIPILKGEVSLNDALVQMQECFEQGDEVDRIVEALSTVKIEDLVELKDGGISKEMVVTTRVTSGKDKDANIQKLRLSPLRTFSEVEIIPSEFSCRWQRQGNTVNVRLIERQHHLWRYQQCEVIAERLRELLPEVRILV